MRTLPERPPKSIAIKDRSVADEFHPRGIAFSDFLGLLQDEDLLTIDGQTIDEVVEGTEIDPAVGDRGSRGHEAESSS